MSFTNLNYHIVFSTKGRRPFIYDDLRPRLAKYIGGIVRELEGDVLSANGPTDHFHVVAILTPKVAVMDVIKGIKGGSSKWIHETFRELPDFDWQDGYAAFTVSQSALPRVIAYVEGQVEHHKKMTFQEELVALLKRHGVKYDERYIFG
jgi:REP element-mobilizing transposase RayT